MHLLQRTYLVQSVSKVELAANLIQLILFLMIDHFIIGNRAFN